MRAVVLPALVAAGVLAAGVVNAQSGAEVAKAKCMGCHDVEKKKVGPSFKDIAAKNKDNKDAGGALVAKLRDGKGHPKVAAPEADLKAAVAHTLATK